MTFADLVAELAARGFDYLQDDSTGVARLKRWINAAYRTDICAVEPWPWLETSTTGTAPLPITDLRDIMYVANLDEKYTLSVLDVRDIAERDPNGLATGPAVGYWLDGSTVKVWPDDGVNLEVRYVRKPTALVSDGDTPLVPEEYRPLIVDRAAVLAYRDSDNWEAANAAQAMFVADMERMTDAEFSRSPSEFIGRSQDHEG